MVRPSWSTEYKFVTRDARARWRAPLGNVAVVENEPNEPGHIRVARLRKLDAVLAPVKGKSLRDGLRPPLTVTARSVRRKIRSGRGDVARQSNKEMTGHDGLDTNRHIQVLGRTPRLRGRSASSPN